MSVVAPGHADLYRKYIENPNEQTLTRIINWLSVSQILCGPGT